MTTVRDRMLVAIEGALADGPLTAGDLSRRGAVRTWTRSRVPENVVRKYLALDIRDNAQTRFARVQGGALVRYALREPAQPRGAA